MKTMAIILTLVLAAGVHAAEYSAPENSNGGEGYPEIDHGMPLRTATTIYDNGNADINTASGNEMTDWIQADDFMLSANGDVNGAECDWFFTSGGTWDGTIEWTIYMDNGGMPGSVVASGMGSDISTTALGMAGGFDWYNTSFSFGETVSLMGGQLYWIGFHFKSVDCDTRDEVYLGYSVNQNYALSQEADDCVAFINVSAVDRAFSLWYDGAVANEAASLDRVKSLFR